MWAFFLTTTCMYWLPLIFLFVQQQECGKHFLWHHINSQKVSQNYPASRVSFNPPRKIGKRKETLLAACTIPIEHAPNSNATMPWVNHPEILKFDTTMFPHCSLDICTKCYFQNAFNPGQFNLGLAWCFMISENSREEVDVKSERHNRRTMHIHGANSRASWKILFV